MYNIVLSNPVQQYNPLTTPYKNNVDSSRANMFIATLVLEPPTRLAAIDTADDEPYEDVPRAEECDDAVEEVVRSVLPHNLKRT